MYVCKVNSPYLTQPMYLSKKIDLLGYSTFYLVDSIQKAMIYGTYDGANQQARDRFDIFPEATIVPVSINITEGD